MTRAVLPRQKDRKIRPGKGKSGYVREHAATGGGKVAGPNDHVAEVVCTSEPSVEFSLPILLVR